VDRDGEAEKKDTNMRRETNRKTTRRRTKTRRKYARKEGIQTLVNEEGLERRTKMKEYI